MAAFPTVTANGGRTKTGSNTAPGFTGSLWGKLPAKLSRVTRYCRQYRQGLEQAVLDAKDEISWTEGIRGRSDEVLAEVFHWTTSRASQASGSKLVNDRTTA